MFSKPLMLSIGAGGAAIAAVVASAASIGSVNSTDLGAGTTVVASCDSSVAVDYTTSYDSTAAAYKVATITISGLAAACIGQDADVTVQGTASDNSTTSIAELGGTVASDGGDPAAAVDLVLTPTASTTILAEDVTGLAVVISG